jgi:hypothetical protein
MTHAALYQYLDGLSEEKLDLIAELARAVNANDRVAIQLALAPVVPPEANELALLAEITDEDRGNTESLDAVCAAEGWD